MDPCGLNELVANISRENVYHMIEELNAYMPDDGVFYPAGQVAERRGPQLPESPPDSSSENPYSPSDRQAEQVYLTIPADTIMQTAVYDEQVKAAMPALNMVQVEEDLLSYNQRAHLGVEEPYPRYVRSEAEPALLPQPLLQDAGVMYTGLQSAKKRRHSDRERVKCEPVVSPERMVAAPASADGSEPGDDAGLQCIRFQPFQPSAWHSLADLHCKPLSTEVFYKVDADKGFNYSNSDEAYVCQKKNHFQVTCHVQIDTEAHTVHTQDGFKKINNFYLHFYGVKVEAPNQTIKVEQSQADRTKKPFHPVLVVRRPEEVTKMTVCRLHFAETTCNNMRKKGKPNPDQRHFQLVVALHAHTDSGDYVIRSQASDRIIVRASNPGQFESECSEGWWQRGSADNTVHYSGRVGINTDRPEEACVIHGNLKLTGALMSPSDLRAKQNVVELDTAQQMSNIQKIRVVSFNYDPSFAEHSGLLGLDPSSRAPPSDIGVIAQEVRRVLPEAVKEAGDVVLSDGHTIDKFLVINKDRIFMENLGAVKELCKVTTHLESRVHRLERDHRKLCRRGSDRSNLSSDSRSTANSSGKSFLGDGSISIDQIREVARNIRRHECCQRISHNSPKYHRKQCRACIKKSDPKYSKKSKSPDFLPPYNPNLTLDRRTKEPEKSTDQEVVYESIKKAQTESCLWVGSDDTERYGCRTKLCCRKERYWMEEGDFISNKFIQVVITILILIMAVCLAVMSVLYFREHRDRIAALQLYNERHYPHSLDDHGVRTGFRPDREAVKKYEQKGVQNRIAGLQPSTVKKTVVATTPKKLTTAKTTRETTTNNIPDASTSATLLEPINLPYADQAKPFEGKASNPFPPGDELTLNDAASAESDGDRVITSHAVAETVGPKKTCGQEINSVNEDPECQIQNAEIPDSDGLEGTKPQQHSEKPHNNTTIMDKQNGENHTAESAVEAESAKMNLLSGQNLSESSAEERKIEELGENATENDTSSRSKRQIANEEIFQDTDVDGCYKISLALSSPTYNNSSALAESVCDPRRLHNVTYSVPVSRHEPSATLNITFRTTPARKLRLQLCASECKYGNSVYCSDLTNSAREELGAIAVGENTFAVQTGYSEERMLILRAPLMTDIQFQNICELPSDHIPEYGYIQYNIKVYRDCQN